jgi:hypothetical protein
MSEELNKPPQALEHNDFEREDLSPAGVFYFMAGLAVAGVLIYFVVAGLYNFLDRYEREHQAAASPLLTPQPYTRVPTHQDTLAFPQPRLEESERTQLRDVIGAQDQRLATYGWVNKNKGIVHIPIERAMDLIAQQGLPVRPESAAGAASAGPQKTKARAHTADHPAGASR